MRDFKDKVVLVTDVEPGKFPSAGIGEGIAVHLAGLGAKLTLTGRDEKNLDRVANLCKSAGSDDSKILCVTGDIRSQSVRESLISKTIEKFGRLDVLVNNAGMIYGCSSTTLTEEQYDEILNVNVKSAVFLTKLAIPHLKESKGNIVNISSIGGSAPVTQYLSYCMSKAALEMFSKCLSLELASSGVRVNTISPGLIETQILRRHGSPFREEESFQTLLNEMSKRIPIGKYGQPIDIARAVAFLASNEQASFITGDTMIIDGAHRFSLEVEGVTL